ncbi:hypothetical protein V8F06_012971 [Rhypophila decipiens]
MHLLKILLAITATPALSLSLPSLRNINPRQVQDFTGRARILVVNSTGYIYDVPDAYNKVIGCINNVGKVAPVSSKNCAIFEKKGDYPTKIVSPEGNNCTHFNVAQPVNQDSYYGKDSYAWYCGVTGDKESKGPGWFDSETYYTINGFDHPYICSGNIGCSRDMPAPPAGPDGRPAKDFSPLPLWMYYWGGEEYHVVKGHVEVLLLWDLLKN